VQQSTIKAKNTVLKAMTPRARALARMPKINHPMDCDPDTGRSVLVHYQDVWAQLHETTKLSSDDACIVSHALKQMKASTRTLSARFECNSQCCSFT
jgi:hypothetical protein